MAHDPEHTVTYLQLPVSEFEALHARLRELEAAKGPIGRTEWLFMQDEIERLRSGWQDAEGQIAALQYRVDSGLEEIGRLRVTLTHEVGFRERAEKDVLDLQGELAAADERIKQLDAESERLRDGMIPVSAKHLNELRDIVARLRAENARLRLFK